MIKLENEKLLWELLNESYPNQWTSDVIFLNGRKFRGDAVNMKHKVVIELNGGLHPFYTVINGKRCLATRSGHSSVEGIERDYAKNNVIVTQGWRLLIYTPKQLRSTPWILISDVSKLIGEPMNENSNIIIKMDGLKRVKTEQVQVRLS